MNLHYLTIVVIVEGVDDRIDCSAVAHRIQRDEINLLTILNACDETVVAEAGLVSLAVDDLLLIDSVRSH